MGSVRSIICLSLIIFVAGCSDSGDDPTADAAPDKGAIDSTVDSAVPEPDTTVDSAVPTPDTTVDSAVPDTAADAPAPDLAADTMAPDTSVDTAVVVPDTSVDSAPVPDTTVDAPAPDTTVDSTVDSTVDLPPPDTTKDTLSPDSTVDVGFGDSTVDSVLTYDSLAYDSTVDAVSTKDPCELQIVPTWRGKVGRRAYHVWGGSAWGDGPSQTTDAGLNEIYLPNEDGWVQTYRVYAWYPNSATCGGACNPSWDAGLGEFTSTTCTKGDVTDLADWSVEPMVVLDPVDAALEKTGDGAFKTRASTNDNLDRVDYVKAEWKGIEDKETVRVCGAPAATPHTNLVDIWSVFVDDVSEISADEAWVGVGGKTDYHASLEVHSATCTDYRLQVTEDTDQWTSVSSNKASVSTSAGQRGRITGKAVGNSLIVATFDGTPRALKVNVGPVAATDCVVRVSTKELLVGGGFGQSMQASINVTRTDGAVINVTGALAVPFCDPGNTGATCVVEYSETADYLKMDTGPGVVTATGTGTGETISATCKKCRMLADGSADDIVCRVSEEVEGKAATVTGLTIQHDFLPCSASPVSSVKLNVDSSGHFKGCLEWDHGARQSLDVDTDDTTLDWSVTSGTDAAVADQDGELGATGEGTTTITATHDSGETADITITSTADKFTSLEITGPNMGISNCATQTGAPDGCIFEEMAERFRLVGKRADNSTQDLTGITGPSDWTATGLLTFSNSIPGFATTGDASDTGTYTDVTVSVVTGFTSTLCSPGSLCAGPTTATVRVYDADPVQASMKLSSSSSSVTGPGKWVTFTATASPNGVSSPPEIDITNAIDFSLNNVAAFWSFDDGHTNGTRNTSGLNGVCISQPVPVNTSATVTATLPQAAIGGTSTTLTETKTITAKP